MKFEKGRKINESRKTKREINTKKSRTKIETKT